MFRLLAYFAAFWITAAGCAWANQDLRTWRLESGESFRAELMNYDESSGLVILRTPEMKELRHFQPQFCVSDRAWLLEWLEIGEELQATLNKLGGRFEHFEVNATFLTEVYVYHPSGTKMNDVLPMIILFDPGGKSARYALRHMEAADAAKIRLVTCSEFRDAIHPQEEEEFRLRFSEVLPVIRHSIVHDRIFLGGTSGGATRAYSYAAEFPIKWAGIYSNSGKLPTHSVVPALRIAMVNGERDPANRFIDGDGAILSQGGSIVGLFAFEGGLLIPTIPVQTQVFSWLLKP